MIELDNLNLRGRGRKCMDENELSTKVNAILEHHGVVDLLNVETTPETKTVHKRAYGKRSDETRSITTAAQEDRARSEIPALSANRARHRLCP